MRTAIVVLVLLLCLATTATAGPLDTLINILAEADGHAVYQYSFSEGESALGLIVNFPIAQVGSIGDKPINLTVNVLGTSDQNGIHLGIGGGFTIPKAISTLSIGIDYATTRGWCLDVGILRF